MIRATSSLREVAFAVCTACERVGTQIVLSGGSAATVYAPEAYQSRDLDFVVFAGGADAAASQALHRLGFRRAGAQYTHIESEFTLDFPAGPLAVGREILSTFDTLTNGSSVLHILTPTDSCKDRLAAFIHWNDRSGLEQALAVARAHPSSLDLPALDDWARTEGGQRHAKEFRRDLSLVS
jgi:hypothetical protein